MIRLFFILTTITAACWTLTPKNAYAGYFYAKCGRNFSCTCTPIFGSGTCQRTWAGLYTTDAIYNTQEEAQKACCTHVANPPFNELDRWCDKMEGTWENCVYTAGTLGSCVIIETGASIK